MSKKEIMIIDEQSLKDKIYIIRGQQVMLDSDLALLYGYTTKTLNQQVKNNIEKFPDDFRFQLSKEETDHLRSKFLTANIGSKSRTNPYVFTEAGIYMLMTILRGDIAVQQSITLIRLFKEMKNHLLKNQLLIEQKNYIDLINQIEENRLNIKNIKEIMISKNDLSDLMKLFSNNIKQEEILILNGQPFKADLAYQNIYKQATNNIIIIDDYISIKTLRHLSCVKDNISITIISDNKAKNHLCLSEYNDFLIEYHNKKIDFIRSDNLIHDRYIILDNNTSKMKVYLSRSSIKDSGNKITTIIQIKDIDKFRQLINVLLKNPVLIL